MIELLILSTFLFLTSSKGIIIYQYYNDYDTECSKSSIQSSTFYPEYECSVFRGGYDFNETHIFQYDFNSTSFECENEYYATYPINECLGETTLFDVVTANVVLDREVTCSYIYSDNQCEDLKYISCDYTECSTGNDVTTCEENLPHYVNRRCHHSVCTEGRCCSEFRDDAQMNDLKIIDAVVAGGSEMFLFILGVISIVVLLILIVVGICGLVEMKKN